MLAGRSCFRRHIAKLFLNRSPALHPGRTRVRLESGGDPLVARAFAAAVATSGDAEEGHDHDRYDSLFHENPVPVKSNTSAPTNRAEVSSNPIRLELEIIVVDELAIVGRAEPLEVAPGCAKVRLRRRENVVAQRAEPLD